MGKIIDIVGKRYGRLVVEKYVGKDKWGKTKWLCRCDCGNIIESDKSSLGKDTNSCGCLRRERTFEHHWTGCGEISGDYWSHMQRNASARKIEFAISIQYAWEQFQRQNGKCALTGRNIRLSPNRKRIKQTASLDRINPSKGYVKDNVQWVSNTLNLCKHTLTNDEFVDMCEQVVFFMKGGGS